MTGISTGEKWEEFIIGTSPRWGSGLNIDETNEGKVSHFVVRALRIGLPDLS